MAETADEIKLALASIKAQVNAATQANKGRTDELATKQSEYLARLNELEMRAARRGIPDLPSGSPHALRAALEAVDTAAEIQAVANKKTRRAVFEMPAGQGFLAPRAEISTTSGATLPDTYSPIVGLPEQALMIRDLLPTVQVNSSSVQYVREVSFTNSAAPVTESNLKPMSDITFETKDCRIVVFASLLVITLQALADTPQLSGFIDRRLRYGLRAAVDQQLLMGSGVGENLEGLYNTAASYLGSTAGTPIDVLRRAITQLQVANYAPSGVILSPSDWEAIALVKSTTNEYVFADPGAKTPPSVWGVPVVVSQAMTAGHFLLGQFDRAAVLFLREGDNVTVSTEDESNFRYNRATLRAEGRLGLATMSSTAMLKGALS